MTSTAEQHVRYHAAEGYAEIVLDRPAKLNALTRAGLRALDESVERAEADEARAVVIRSTASRAFCAGADLNDFGPLAPTEALDASRLGTRALNRLAHCPIPTVAQISGYCLGGGVELALACDLRVADETAIFGFPEVTLGETLGWGGLVRLVALVGPGAAKELLLTARRFGAPEASRIGLLQTVVPSTHLSETVRALAVDLASHPVAAQRAIKHDIDALARHAGLADELQSLRSAINAGSDVAHDAKAAFPRRSQHAAEQP